MALRPCLGYADQQCTQLTDRGNRCAKHQRLYEQHRRPVASARQRYPASHDALRARLLPLAYGTPCPRCGEPMELGQALDLGHPEDAPRATHPGTAGQRIEHARCNRSAGSG